jgi:hypothetical protein
LLPCAEIRNAAAAPRLLRLLCSTARAPAPNPQADKLLSPEFQPLIEQLISFLPEDRQIMLFSATFPVTVKQFKEKFLRKVRRAAAALALTPARPSARSSRGQAPRDCESWTASAMPRASCEPAWRSPPR